MALRAWQSWDISWEGKARLQPSGSLWRRVSWCDGGKGREVFLLCTYAAWGEGNGTPLQHSCLENPMDGGAWWAAVHGVTKSWTRLSDFTFTFHFLALEKEMATHSSVFAWRIPGIGEPGGLPSVGSHRVEHDWSNLAAAAAAINIRVNFSQVNYIIIIPIKNQEVLYWHKDRCLSSNISKENIVFKNRLDHVQSTNFWPMNKDNSVKDRSLFSFVYGSLQSFGGSQSCLPGS